MLDGNLDILVFIPQANIPTDVNPTWLTVTKKGMKGTIRNEIRYLSSKYQGRWSPLESTDDIVVNDEDEKEHDVNKEEKKHECTNCSKVFKTKRCLYFHNLKVHSLTKNCNVCQQQLSNTFLLKRHMKEKHGNYEDQCEKCGQLFSRRYVLNEHLKLCGNKRRRKGEASECTICSKKYSDGRKLKTHMEETHIIRSSGGNFMITHMGNTIESQLDDRIFTCTICMHEFDKKKKLKIHMKTVHHGFEDSDTLKVGNMFLKKNERTDDSRKLQQCFSCNEMFSRKVQLDEHIKMFHKGEKIYSCCKCDKKFESKRKVQCHVKDSHPANLKECSICNKQFKTNQALNRHEGSQHRAPKVKKSNEKISLRELKTREAETISKGLDILQMYPESSRKVILKGKYSK